MSTRRVDRSGGDGPGGGRSGPEPGDGAVAVGDRVAAVAGGREVGSELGLVGQARGGPGLQPGLDDAGEQCRLLEGEQSSWGPADVQRLGATDLELEDLDPRADGDAFEADPSWPPR